MGLVFGPNSLHISVDMLLISLLGGILDVPTQHTGYLG